MLTSAFTRSVPDIDLAERFGRLWRRCLLPHHYDRADAIFADLVCRYREPHRRYHGWAHLTHCLAQVDLAAPLMDSSESVELALWFHDAVYHAGGRDNETESARLFEAAQAGGFPESFVQKVSDYILLTRHSDPPSDLDGCFVVDIDLSPLAVRWPNYLRDSENIRWEAPHISDEAFFQGQCAFLKSMLARPRIFLTEFFFTRCETQARENLKAFIERLEAAGFG